MNRPPRAREKDHARRIARREANAPEPSAVFEAASDEEVTIDAIWQAEHENQAGLRLVDLTDGVYRTETKGAERG